jgi:glutamate 5-kinase
MSFQKKRIVVKVGTSTITNEVGNNDLRSIDHLSRVLADVHNLGYEVILVSSGAIAVGSNKLMMPTKPVEMRLKQAAAAVGQCSIMFFYDKFFSEYDKTIGQVLLNAEDMEVEEKKENLASTFEALLEMGVIPVVNENDSVSYTEIESEDRLFSDNDKLSAVVAILCNADRLIILSDINGLYDKDPRFNPDAELIPLITEINDYVYSIAGGAGSRRGTGGMKTKLAAASMVMSQGIEMSIINGRSPEKIFDILDEKPAGTLFRAE